MMEKAENTASALECSMEDGSVEDGTSSGTHMVDMVDPDAVDFQPLLTSINGAAMTAITGGDDDDDDDDGDDGNDDNDEEAEGGGREEEVAEDDQVMMDPSEMETMPLQHHRRQQEHRNGHINGSEDDSDSTGKLKGKPNRASNSSFVASLLSSLLPSQSPTKPSNRNKSFHSFAGMTSRLLVCSGFFLLVVLVSTASNFIAVYTGIVPSPSGTRAASQTSKFGKRSVSIYHPNSNSNNHGHGAGEGEVDMSMSPQGIYLAPPLGTQVAHSMRDVFANVDDLPMELMDTAIFWHVPRSGGITMKHVLATCLGRVITTEIGGMDGHNLDERLQIIKKPHGIFLNVDTTTPTGLKHAREMGLVQSKMADVIFTPYVQEAAVLFDKNHRGRFFTLLRDPVDRVVSLYYYRRMATWEPNYNSAIRDQTLEDFIQTSGENWMVRTLTGCMSGSLDTVHLNAAKEIFRTKFLIGLLEEKTESLRRFEEYFGWKFPSPVSQTCKNNMYYFEWHSRNPHPPLEQDDPLVTKIRNLNMWDVELYEYARQLFREQEVLFWETNDDITFPETIGGLRVEDNMQEVGPAEENSAAALAVPMQ